MTVTTLRLHGTAARYKKGPDEHGTPGKGCRCGPCTRAAAAYRGHRSRMIAYGRWEPRTDATGTRRRIQALMRNGWSAARLSARLGGDESHARKILGCRSVAAATEQAVRALYDELWDQLPPRESAPDRRGATRARNFARERGWPPPAAWDDDTIDDPGASPAEGWERRDDVRRWGTLAQEAAELIGLGVGQDRVAERLGVSKSTLGTTMARARKREAVRDAA